MILDDDQALRACKNFKNIFLTMPANVSVTKYEQRCDTSARVGSVH